MAICKRNRRRDLALLEIEALCALLLGDIEQLEAKTSSVGVGLLIYSDLRLLESGIEVIRSEARSALR